MLLKHPRSLTIRGDGGEAEVRPDSECELQWVDGQTSSSQIWQRQLSKRDTQEQNLDPQRLRSLWREENRDAHDTYGEATVISTLACCLVLLGKAKEQQDATVLATKWWQNRNRLLM
jgi:anthranilate phosphoribosyltransferase